MLIPSLRLMTSASVSRIVRAMKGSTWALPPKPRFISWTPLRRAATTGQICVGEAALEPWLMELP